MSRFKHAVNSAHTKPWVERVGKIVVNFSGLELESILWSLQLSERPDQIRKFAEIPFAARVKQLMSMVEDRNINPKWRKAALRTWNESLKLAIVRNQVAHNPIVFGWRTSAELGEPDFIGIPNLRGSKSKSADWSLSKGDADRCIDEIVDVVKRVGGLRVEWCQVRDAGAAPPAHSRTSSVQALRRYIGKAFKRW